MVDELFASAGLVPQGPVPWRMHIPKAGVRVYVLVSDGEVVYIGQDPHAGTQSLPPSAQALWTYWTSTSDPSGAEAKMLHLFRSYATQLPSGNR